MKILGTLLAGFSLCSGGAALAADDRGIPSETLQTVGVQESQDHLALTAAQGNLHFQAPGTWKKIEPRSTMIEVELAIPKVENDPADGRLTIMGSGGSIEANIERWYGQFTQPDGGATADVAKVEKKEINGLTVHFVDISGQFAESMGGPQAPTMKRDNYRMLAVIVETESHGKYFVKLTGPQATIEKNAAGFRKMIESVKETQ